MNDLLLTCTYDDVKRLDAGDVRWLYVSDYYDHPLTGVVQWNGGRYWIQYAEWDGQELRTKEQPLGQFIPAAYFLFDLPVEQWAAEDRRHSLFRECVGTHWDYDYGEDGKRTRETYTPTGREKEYYGAYPPGKNNCPTSGKLVAYLDESHLWMEAAK